jgi:hypothetical protein
VAVSGGASRVILVVIMVIVAVALVATAVIPPA